ncbi:MAG: hypothetical protein U5J98_08640 [Halobacteriales archaeon]|nr:hypothetical protein [Halobacteriales archaeon]
MAGPVPTTDLERFGVSAEHGFLPDEPPLASFGADAPPFLSRLDELANGLDDLLAAGELRDEVDGLEPPPDGWLEGRSTRETERAYTVCGFLANGYVNQRGSPDVDVLPAGIAVPLSDAASALGRTPVLSYDAYALYNWRRLDSAAGMGPQDLEAIHRFSGLPDERWFVVIHVAIESAAGPALAAIGPAQAAVADGDDADLVRALRTVEEGLHDLIALLDRMREHNAPERYDQGFRPYLEALRGVEYEGVDALEGPQTFRGASGAQSSVFPALDAAVGVDHGDNPLVEHLESLRADMPPAHRAFVEAAADGPAIRGYAAEAGGDVRTAYNDAVDAMVRFRELHVEVVSAYLAEGEAEGTGGTPYARFLSMFTEDTRDCRLPA